MALIILFYFSSFVFMPYRYTIYHLLSVFINIPNSQHSLKGSYFPFLTHLYHHSKWLECRYIWCMPLRYFKIPWPQFLQVSLPFQDSKQDHTHCHSELLWCWHFKLECPSLLLLLFHPPVQPHLVLLFLDILQFLTTIFPGPSELLLHSPRILNFNHSSDNYRFSCPSVTCTYFFLLFKHDPSTSPLEGEILL